MIKVDIVSRTRIAACCLALILAAGCRAQVPSGASADRRIEVLIRSQFSVPTDYDVMLGGRTKSDIPGYENLPVTFVHEGKSKTLDFLISHDGNTLARLEKFDLSKDPASAISFAETLLRRWRSSTSMIWNVLSARG